MSNRLLIPILGLGQIVAFASSYYLLGVLADPLAAGAGTTPSVVFLALSGAFLVSGLLSPATGRWIDAAGGRTVLAVSNLVFALALIVLASSRSPEAMAVGVLLLGVGMAAGLYGTAFAVLVEAYGEAAKRPIAAVSLIGAFGGGLGWPLTLAIIDAVGWRGACLGWAGAHLLLCLPLTALLPHRPRQPASQPVAAAVRWDATMIRLAVLFAGTWVVATAMGAHMPRLLGRLGLSPAEAAGAASLMAGSAILIRLLSLTSFARACPVLTTRLATLMHPLGAVVALIGGKGLAAAVAVGQGAGSGLLSVASGVLPLHLFGRENYATRHALLLTPARFLQAAAPAAYGLLLDRSATLALAVSGGVCLIMFAMTVGLRRSSQPFND